MAGIAASSDEQFVKIEHISNAVSGIEHITQQNAADAQEAAAVSEEMNSQAEQMRGIVDKLADIIGG
ncbi:hypothetical protein QUF72_00280 [Desulfobacterales bacterium HSG2]|nr:hypothetical protein [Desulfobacterales bacterium HSG2]